MILTCAYCGHKGKAKERVALARYECGKCGRINEVTNVPLREWLDFNFEEYLVEIISFIEKDEFTDVLARDAEELARGRLSKPQVSKLKTVLKKNFRKGGTIRNIRNDIVKNVKPGDLEAVNGRVFPEQQRALAIARTETTRTANAGSQNHYAKGGIEEYSWVATFDGRTCPICQDLDGQIFGLRNGPLPPAHGLCRCTIIPVVDL